MFNLAPVSKSYVRKTLLLSLVLALLATGVWFVARQAVSLSDAFFWTGAVPTLFGTIGSFGAYSGRGDVNFQMSKTVFRESSADRAMLEIEDLKLWQSSTWHWLGAGVLVCAVSVFLP
jgi:hypothetical protein